MCANKHLAGRTSFSPDRTLVFVHGATYPASTAFDLELGGLSWMDYIARRGFDVYLLDLPGYGRSTRPAAMDAPAEAGQPVETTAEAVRDYGAVVDWVLKRRNLDKVDAMGWSWGTTIAGGYAAEHPTGSTGWCCMRRSGCRLPRRRPPKPQARRLPPRHPRGGLQRWLREVPADKQADLIPAGWFDAWQSATWATDPKSAGTSPPVLRAPNGVTLDFGRYWAAGQPTFDPSKITAPT